MEKTTIPIVGEFDRHCEEDIGDREDAFRGIRVQEDRCAATKSKSNDWDDTKETESRVRNEMNRSKPLPGCRQIQFKLMKRKLSQQAVDDDDVDNLYVHQEPCIFCRILESRTRSERLDDYLSYKIDQKNSYCHTTNFDIKLSQRRRPRRGRELLYREERAKSGENQTQVVLRLSKTDVMVRNIMIPFLSPPERTVLFDIPEWRNIFRLENHFCPKHGNEYKPDDKIFRSAAESAKKKSNGSRKTKKRYFDYKDILEEIIHDGRDPIVFRNKLAYRTQPFPPHMVGNKSVNQPEVSLFEDPDYGSYFCKMKKCMACEKEADVRQMGKQGLGKCTFCSRFCDFRKQRRCAKDHCDRILPCSNCPETVANKSSYQCNHCLAEFCTDCHETYSCTMCETSICDGCHETSGLDFHKCSLCENTMCSKCDATYSCEHCGKCFCYHCRDGGAMNCGCGNAVFCNECVPQQLCNICGERKCLECCGTENNLVCSVCGGSSCKDCAEVYHCEVCDQSFCYGCRDQRPSSPNTSCKKCKNVVCCSHCVRAAPCSNCRKLSCLVCSRQKQRCAACGRFSCNDCGGTTACPSCNLYHCSDCSLEREASCADCGGRLCTPCDLYSSAPSLGTCKGCGDRYCFDCRFDARCETCSGVFCSKCIVVCEKSSLRNCRGCLVKLEEIYGKYF